MDIFQEALAAQDAVAFAQLVGIEADPWQQKMLRTKSRRLLLNCSRQAGKSTSASVLGLHRAIYKPESLILLVSPSMRQSSELFRKVLSLLNQLEPRPSLTEESATKLTLDNGSRIVSLPSSEETIRGYSAVNLMIIDESSRVEDVLYESVRPMLAVSNGSLILMSTPHGKRGHFYEAWENGGDIWERIKITVDQVPRISPEFVAEERARGDFFFKQEYCGEFLDTDNQVFSTEYIEAAFRKDVEAWSL